MEKDFGTEAEGFPIPFLDGTFGKDVILEISATVFPPHVHSLLRVCILYARRIRIFDLIFNLFFIYLQCLTY